jgi:hypothetical protein
VIARRFLLVLALLAAGCAEQPVMPPGDVGAKEWRPYRNADGRELLAHTNIEKCYVDPTPPQDFNQRGFTVRREQRTVGVARYDVANVYQDRDFYIAVYRAEGSPTPLLGVYSEGRCREAAERMLLIVQKRKGPG